MGNVSIDLAELSGLTPGVDNLKDAVVWFYPYSPYGAPQLVTTDKLVVDTVDGVGSTFLPQTPAGNGVYVEIRRVRLPESSRKFLVAIPAGDCNLFDLPHLDPDTLDPDAPLDPAWLALFNAAIPTGGTTGQVLAKASNADYDDEWVDQSGGGGAVDSVNTQTGIVALDQDDIPDGTTAKQYSATEKAKLAAITGTNTGDQDLSALVPKTTQVNGHALSANVTVTKADVGLGSVDNTADTSKPVSTAQAAADTAIGVAAATDATTKANAAQTAAASDATTKVATETTRATTAEALLAPKASPTFTGTVSGITKSMVGLGSVDNTADTAKPVSTAQATADTAIGTAAATDATTKANAAQAVAIQRVNHTGTQTASTISDFSTAADARVVAGITAKADLASPTFTGDPKAPTPAAGDNDTSIATTAFVNANAQPLRKRAKYVDTISGFFGTNGYFWSGGQRTTTTTLTSSILAGATVLPVADATGIVAGMSLLLAGGTSSQKVVQVLSVASLNVTLVSGTGVPAQASGATVGMVWADSVHLTSEGYTGIAYAVMNAKNADGTDVFSVASGERVTFIGNSWFAGNTQWATATTNKFSGALVTNVGVGGDHGTDVIARFATDVPSTSKYVVFNEPGGNSLGSDSMPLITAQLAVLVRLIQGIGAIPIYTGTAPIPGLATTSAAMITDLFRDGYSMAAADGIVGFTDQALTTWFPGTADNTTAATFTNKRITKRAYSNTTATSWTIAADSFDVATLTALAAGCTINAPSGTPTAGQSLIIRIKDNGTARALTWNSIFRVVGTTLPTTTVISKTVYVGCVFNSDDTKFDVVAVAQEA